MGRNEDGVYIDVQGRKVLGFAGTHHVATCLSP